MSAPNHSRLEDKVIEAFVMYLARKLYPGLQVIKWPDKDNTRTPDIDAIAETSGKRIAIEHTIADSLPDQRLHNDRFMEAIGCLEEELKGRINCRLRVTIPFGSVPTGIPWNGVRDRFRSWILHDIPQLPYNDIVHNIRIEGVLSRSLYRSVILPRMVYFSRAV
jgi:hypothetical protein